MLLHVVEPLPEVGHVKRSHLRDVLAPYLVGQALLLQSSAMTLRALSFGQKLRGPLLRGRGVVVLHDGLEILDDTVEGHKIVARRAYDVLVDAYVLERTVQDLAHRLVRDVPAGRLQRAVVFLENGIDLPEDHLVFIFAQWRNGTVVYAHRVIGNHLLQVNLVDIAQSLAMRACPFGRVEREDIGRWLAVGKSGHGVHEALGEILGLARVAVHDHDDTVTLAHGNLHRVLQAFVVLALHLELVHHHFDVVVLVSVHLHAPRDLLDLSVHTDVEVSLLAHALEEFAVMSLALSDEGCEDIDGVSDIVCQDHVDDLLLGVFHHLLAAEVAVGRGRAGEEQPEIVVDLRRGAHGGARVLVGGLLLDADHRREARYLVHIGALHVSEEIARIGREGLDVTTLPFGVDGVEGERRLARPRQTGDDRQRVARYLHIHILEVVHTRAPHIDPLRVFPENL